jgi:histidinol dehydrogenase
MILSESGNARSIAADMLAQAEHDTDASAILVTTSEPLATAVRAQIEEQLSGLPTADVARVSIERNSAIILVPDVENGLRLANNFAPEHLSLHDPSLLSKIRNAGTVFLGENSPESAGDYAAGPSHVLPTSGAARLRGGLSAVDFVKVIAIQQLSPAALKELAPAITTLARAEGLEAHARAVEVRSV